MNVGLENTQRYMHVFFCILSLNFGESSQEALFSIIRFRPRHLQNFVFFVSYFRQKENVVWVFGFGYISD